jgi:methylmalonyl-CoA mutase, N-terminal domain
LAAIKDAVNSGQNMMPTVIAAVEANCTLGEISDVLRNLFGEYQA